MLRLLQRGAKPFASLHPTSSSLSSLSPLTTQSPENERLENTLKVGDEFEGYKLLQTQTYPTRNMKGMLFSHKQTGAKHLHIHSKDENNVFSVTFKTCPQDSRGVAHILEHTALCGSEKYPVRDPFFNMTRRSLNTYMNAWTAADYTMYPFSTQNQQDYHNLMSVYLDASFHPLLNELDFMQEGHRLEEEKGEGEGPASLVRKGVVYNEMKGAMSDAAAQFYHKMQEYLHPTTTYHYNSGGEPREIPKLTWNDLKDFHSTHYHPSNSFFFSYGSMPLADSLTRISKVLDNFEPIVPDTEIKREKRHKEPLHIKETCIPTPGEDLSRQVRVGKSFLVGDIADTYLSFSMAFLSSLLLYGPNSPMYKALIAPNIGMDYVTGTGFSSHTRDTSFCVGLQGILEEDVPRVLQIIDETLEKVAQEGFPQERIDALFHQTEYDLKNVTGNFGLNVASGVMSGWIHGCNPLQQLDAEYYLEKLKKDLEKGDHFQKLIREHLINNTHQVTLEMKPDPEYVEKEAKHEENELKNLEKTISEEERVVIREKTKELEDWQANNNDPSCLPSLTLGDVSLTTDPTDFITSPLSSSSSPRSVQWTPQPTNGISFIRSIGDAFSLPPSLHPFLPLYCMALSKGGAGDRDHLELAQFLESHTGGISASPFIARHPCDRNQARVGVYVGGSALDRNTDLLTEILGDILTKPDFSNTEHTNSLLFQKYSEMEENLVSSGHSYALSRACANLDHLKELEEQWSGLPHFRLLAKLVKGEITPEELKDKFDQITSHLLSNSTSEWAVNAESSHFPSLTNSLTSLFSTLPSPQTPPPPSPFHSLPSPSPSSSPLPHTFIPIPSSVHFGCMAVPGVNYDHPDHVALQIMGKISSSTYLHQQVREKGGAYGAGLAVSPSCLAFYSYRDPHNEKTLETFQNCGAWVVGGGEGEVNDRVLSEAKLSLFSDLDHPVSPGRKGLGWFEHRVDHEMRQNKRQRVMDVTKEDVMRVADQYLVNAPKSSVVVLGPEGGQGEGWDVMPVFQEEEERK